MQHNGFEIYGDGKFGQKLIRRLGKGALPAELRGSFTNTRFAIMAIDSVKGKSDAKNDSNG